MVVQVQHPQFSLGSADARRGELHHIGAAELAKLGFVEVPGSRRMQSIGRRYGNVSIWGMRGKASEFVMYPADDATPTLSFVFIESGVLSSQPAGKPWVTFDAPLIVMPEMLERRIRLSGSWRVVVVQVPLPDMQAFTPLVPAEVGIFKKTRLLDHAMHQFVATLLQAERQGSAVENHAVAQVLIEMAGGVLVDRMGSDAAYGSPSGRLVDRALTAIAEHCCNADITPRKIAELTRISLRQLQTVFTDAGLTVATEIRRARARSAAALLTDVRYDHLSIEQVAERAGFSTTASLRRAIESVYELSPSAVRERRR